MILGDKDKIDFFQRLKECFGRNISNKAKAEHLKNTGKTAVKTNTDYFLHINTDHSSLFLQIFSQCKAVFRLDKKS